MTFAEDLARLPYEAREQDAKGFLPPIARAVTHLTFVLAHENEEGVRHIEDDEALNELTHAQLHWQAIAGKENLSATSREHVENYGTAIDSAVAEFAEWDHDTRISNLRDLANRGAGLMAVLDRELVGLKGSDPGFSL